LIDRFVPDSATKTASAPAQNRHQADRPDEEHPPSRHDPAATPNADGRDRHRSQQAQQAERPERPCAFHGIGHEERRRDDDDQQIQPLPLDPN
jgi:hypothetical protein